MERYRAQELQYDPSYLLAGGVASFLLNILLFRFVSPSVSACLSPAYTRLPRHVRAEWDDRFISNVNALVSIALSSYTLLWDAGMHEDRVWHDTFAARLACAVVVGYMVADLACMVAWCRVSRGEIAGYLFHHAATIYAYYFISAYGVLCYFGMLRLIAEASTPTVNQRWYFDKLEYSRSRPLVVLNGFLMVATFFLFRMCAMPVYWFQVWQVAGSEAVTRLGHIRAIMFVPTFVLDVLNTFWFYKMCRGFIKAIRTLKTPLKDMERKTV
ncbi:TLC domain-containing protein 4-A-like [Mya arenaria]|uniref:TLC domain-containing protein 4-A-like n=1 Tax=Mya arenaria TaxID=6604 RepID=UPI0022E35B9A|nr:TLC domain-containing protein 4-A-like [Mya arenaria]